MSNRNAILKALAENGISTYDALEHATQIPRNKLRWAVNDLKGEKLLTQTEDSTTLEIAWKITELGRSKLKPEAVPAKPVAAAPSKPAKAVKEETKSASKEISDLKVSIKILQDANTSLAVESDHRKQVISDLNAKLEKANEHVLELEADVRRQVQRAEAAESNRNDLSKYVEHLEAQVIAQKSSSVNCETTPAAGGANNSGSDASESPVGAASTLPESAVVDETRAGCHGPEAQHAAEPVVSDVKTTLALAVDIRMVSPHAGELHVAIDRFGKLTIGELTFCPAEARAIGQFLIDTEPSWA